MNDSSPRKIEIKTATCRASFTQIYPQLDYVRVEGWITSPSRDEGFEFSAKIAKAIGREHLGGFCLEDNNPVNFPFSFDEEKAYLPKFGRFESREETVNRIERALRRVRLEQEAR
jgi:hypothetical protein